MTKEEYEDKYREALATIIAEYMGAPYVTHDGVRAVRIENFPHTDEMVFKRAWGEEAAREIMRHRP